MPLEFLIEDLKKRSNLIYDDIYFLLEINEYKAEKKKLFFNIVDSDEINGRAWCNDKEDHVEINKGVIRTAYDLFLEINKYYKNEFLKKIVKNESEENIEQMSFEAIVFDNGMPKMIDSKRIVDDRTNLLGIFAWRFILLHEFGHIFNGHCSYLTDREKKNAIIPMYYTDNVHRQNISALDIRTMEMDADMFAVTQSIWHLLFLYRDFDSQVQCEGLKPMDLFYWWAFAVRSHFLLCGDRLVDTNRYSEEMKHLPSNARWRMIVNTAVEIIENMINPTVLNISEACGKFFRGAEEAEVVFNELKFTSYSFYDELCENGQYKHYCNQVNTNWKKIVKELKAYNRCPLFEG